MKSVKQKIKQLPLKLGLISLAIIIAIGEGMLESLEQILREGKSLTMSKVAKKLHSSKNFWFFYKKLENLTNNNFKVVLHRLQKRGLIEKRRENFRLSPLGVLYFKRISDHETPQKWDNKWRIIMFDIPESIRNKRNWLRQQLYTLEYKSLQKSVFIGKHPLKEKLYKEILEQGLNKYLNLITVGEIDDEEILKSFD
jgi:hypothetical protein